MPFGLEAIDDHLQAYFPDAEQFILQERQIKGTGHIDVHVVMPTERRSYFVLVTSGMSNQAMHVPDGFGESARAECFLCLPGDWPLSMINQGWREPEFALPIFLLQEIARFPSEHETWLGYGHSVPLPHPLDAAGRFSGVSLLEPLLMPQDFIAAETADDDVIWLLPVIPCTLAEMEFKRARGYAALSERFQAAGVSELLDPARPSVAPMQ